MFTFSISVLLPLFLRNCCKLTFFHTSAALNALIFVNGVRLFYSAADCTDRADSGAEGAALTEVRVNLIAKQFLTNAGRALFIHNVRNVLVAEIAEGGENRVRSGLAKSAK